MKHLIVSSELHKQVKSNAVAAGLTIDQYLRKIV